ncbi:MAG: hypothetical protein ACK559_07335, partial [bacterium]
SRIQQTRVLLDEALSRHSLVLLDSRRVAHQILDHACRAVRFDHLHRKLRQTAIVVDRARYYGSSAKRALLHLFRCHRHNVLGNNVGRHHIKVLVEVLIAAPLNFIDVIQ